MRRNFRLSASLVTLCSIVLWNEWLSYRWMSLKWSIEPATENSMRILVIADPQLIGYHNENEFIGPLARWDSDRYLASGFNLAMDKTQPNVIIFLGDLFDEGVESSQKEFEMTVSRFYSVFDLKHTIKRSFIFIPGDNDVGGEYEPVSRTRSDRFVRSFPNYTPDLTFCKYFNFSTINMFDASAELLSLCKFPTYSNRNPMNVLISHMALRDPFALYNKQILSYAPRFIMAGHLHKAAIDNITIAPFSLTTEDMTNNFDLVQGFLNTDSIIQLLFPTCSYRMGTPSVGYGFVVLKYATNEFSFSVLWLPCRFTHFKLYIFIIFVIAANAVRVCLFRSFRSRLPNCCLV